MFLLFWIFHLLLPFVSCHRDGGETDASASMASLFQSKCEGLPFRTKYISDSMTCYVSRPLKMDCSNIEVTYGKLKNGVPSSDRRKLKAVGITDESGICAFKISGDSDCELSIEGWCFHEEKKKLNFYDAAEVCEQKGQTLPVVHNDNDLQRLLKATHDLKYSHAWIGEATVQSSWKLHDNSEVDFFRLKPLEGFIGNELGMLFLSKSQNDSYSAYTGVSDVNKEHTFICVQPIKNDYRRPIQRYRFQRPETTTTAKPTTRYPRIQNPKEWITDPGKGQKIYGIYNTKKILHYYTFDPVYKPSGFDRREQSNGFVVTEARFPEIQETCPELMKVGIWRQSTITYIGNNPPSQFTLSESFYCSPRQFYCGANFLLRRLDKVKGGDIYYFWDDEGGERRLSTIGPSPVHYRQVRGGFLETPCWIWQDYQETNATIVKAGGGMIWSRNGVQNRYQWSYSLDIYEMPLQEQGNHKAGPGYVILEEAYDAYFKEKCPELIPMRVWHGSNG